MLSGEDGGKRRLMKEVIRKRSSPLTDNNVKPLVGLLTAANENTHSRLTRLDRSLLTATPKSEREREEEREEKEGNV